MPEHPAGNARHQGPAYVKEPAEVINPKSETKMAALHQAVGHKRFGKISPDHCGYGFDFSKPFMPNSLTHPGHFYFGFRDKDIRGESAGADSHNS